MFNPLIIFCIYYWVVCLTHNLYVTYYNYIHNINKRIKFYKYLLFLISLIFYIFILLNIHYSDYQVISKNFYLITNYNQSFIDFFYICGMIMIVYIIIKLYYVLNKKEDFISINEYQENHERNEKIKNIFNSVINRNISFIIYFLVTFTPTNIAMIFRYILSYTNFQVYFIDFMTILLICFSGTFILCLRLLDPLMRRFLINLILFNREFITKYKEHILKEKQMNESFVSNSLNETFLNNESSSDKIKIVRNYKKSKTIKVSPTSLNFGKLKSAASQEISNFGTSPKFNRKESSSDKFEMKNLNNDNISDLNELEEYYYNENQDNAEDNKSKNNDNDNNNSQKIRFSSSINSAEIILKEKEEEKKEDKKEDKKEEEKKDNKDNNKEDEKKENKDEKENNKKEGDKPKKKGKKSNNKKKGKTAIEKYVNPILAKAEKELFKGTPTKAQEPVEQLPAPVPKKRERKKHEKITDNNKICHYFLKKGINVNITEYDSFPIQKVKKQNNNILSKLNFNINKFNPFKSKKKEVQYTDYYLFIDECFIYFLKDEILFESDHNKRRIGSVVSFFNITSIKSEKVDNTLFKIIIEIKYRNDIKKTKEFYIDPEYFRDLMALFKEIVKENDFNCIVEMK